MTALTLYSNYINSAGERVRIALELKGVAYDYVAVRQIGIEAYRGDQSPGADADTDGRRRADRPGDGDSGMAGGELSRPAAAARRSGPAPSASSST